MAMAPLDTADSTSPAQGVQGWQGHSQGSGTAQPNCVPPADLSCVEQVQQPRVCASLALDSLPCRVRLSELPLLFMLCECHVLLGLGEAR